MTTSTYPTTHRRRRRRLAKLAAGALVALASLSLGGTLTSYNLAQGSQRYDWDSPGSERSGSASDAPERGASLDSSLDAKTRHNRSEGASRTGERSRSDASAHERSVALADARARSYIALGESSESDALRAPGERSRIVSSDASDAPDAGVSDDASDDASDDFDLGDALVDLYYAARGGDWRLTVALLLSIAMFVATRFKVRTWKVFRGDRGGALLVMALALTGGLSAALFAAAPVNGELLLGVIATAFTSAGGYTWVKKVLWPRDVDEPEPKPELDEG